MTSLIVGTAALNAILLSVGYALLATALRGSAARVWASYAGVALLTGVATVLVSLCAVAATGVPVGIPAFAAVALVLTGAGIGCAYGLSPAQRPRFAPSRAEAGAARPVEDVVATGACTAVVALLAMTVVGAFRASPWLDDVWTFWLTKGIALDDRGLDTLLFVPNGTVKGFPVPDYPLGWSILTNLDIRFAGGDVDLRSITVQSAFLVVGAAATVARLLWGIVRPWLLWCGLLALLAMPELLRHAQGGIADLPLALFVAVAMVAAGVWLYADARLTLLLAAVFAAGAFTIKSESYPDLMLGLALLTWAARPLAGRRVWHLWAATAVAALTSVPWHVWKLVHGLPNQIRLGDMFSPSYLADSTSSLRSSADLLLGHYGSVREWLFVLPVAAAVGTVGAVLDRRRDRWRLWLALPLYVMLSFTLLVWIFWADRTGEFRLISSVYRLVDPFVLTAGLAAVVAVEFLLRQPLARGRPRAQV